MCRIVNGARLSFSTSVELDTRNCPDGCMDVGMSDLKVFMDFSSWGTSLPFGACFKPK